MGKRIRQTASSQDGTKVGLGICRKLYVILKLQRTAGLTMLPTTAHNENKINCSCTARVFYAGGKPLVLLQEVGGMLTWRG